MASKKLEQKLLEERVENEHLLSLDPKTTTEDILVQYSCNTKYYRWAGKEKGFEPCNPPLIREEVKIIFMERCPGVYQATYTFLKKTQGDAEFSYDASMSPFTIRPDVLERLSHLPAEVYAVIKGVMDKEHHESAALFNEDQQL